VEQYKKAKHMSGAESISQLDSYGVLDYLADNYEILHTQSHRWLLEDIDEFINARIRKSHDSLPR
jgi:hypothetical protein